MPRIYRLLLGVFHLVGLALGFRPRLVGAQNLPVGPGGRPEGGWIAAVAPHRTWIDPFVLFELLPLEPRLVWFGDGRAIFGSWWRRLFVRRIGGVVPIWPGGGLRAFESHVSAVRSVLEAGAVFAIFPEVGPPAPPDRARPLAPGLGYFALRSGAPIVPMVLGGTHELYLRRRMQLRVLPPMTARQLARIAPHEPLPEPGSRAERAAARGIVAELECFIAPDVARAYAATEPPPTFRKRWGWLGELFH